MDGYDTQSNLNALCFLFVVEYQLYFHFKADNVGSRSNAYKNKDFKKIFFDEEQNINIDGKTNSTTVDSKNPKESVNNKYKTGIFNGKVNYRSLNTLL